MDTLELIEEILLIVTYTILVITVFVQFVCYKRNLEAIETIFFTLSLLFLIISLSLSPFAGTEHSVRIVEGLRLLSFISVGLNTPLNVFTEREVHIGIIWKRALIVFSSILAIATVIGFFVHALDIVQYVIVVFLGISVLGSMLLLLLTRPVKKLKHRQRTEQIFAVAFTILVPLSLATNFIINTESLKIGFTIPLVFSLLAGMKLQDDIQRLSLLLPKFQPSEQALLSYQLTDREKEIALLLIQGKTYKQISEQLYISMPTVKTHSSNIYRKCGVNTRSELTALNFS